MENTPNEPLRGDGQINANEPILSVHDLDVRFSDSDGEVRVIRGIGFEILQAEVHGFVGESGSGKTVTSKAVLGILPRPQARIAAGTIRYKGRNLLELDDEAYRKVRGAEIAMIFQEPARYLNPSMQIRRQIGETLEAHRGMSRAESGRRAEELLRRVGLDARVADAYPHELSGGMKQRALIAIAVSCTPGLLIADEPTTALDITLQRQILGLILSLRDEYAMSVLLISHDLGVMKLAADRISVMYAGSIVESAATGPLFREPLHPYTALLIASVPGPDRRGKPLAAIPGRLPDAKHVPPGCPFHPRCPIAEEICGRVMPPFLEHRPGHFAACHFAGTKTPLRTESGGSAADGPAGETERRPGTGGAGR
jgi:oligopeptide/dipeptide ABC transporter ATP-binding protein